jgi:hypothetical protein
MASSNINFNLIAYLLKVSAKVVQIERNTKEKLAFLWISEMKPTFEAKPQSSANRAKYQRKARFSLDFRDEAYLRGKASE